MRIPDSFFEYARKREQIRRQKAAGQPPPWTEDPIFQQFRFCNVFREDDKVTRWFQENLRGPLRDDPFVITAVTAFRWFNRIETGEALKPMLMERVWDSGQAKELIYGNIPEGPWTTGSYMIKSPAGKRKVEGLCECIERVAVHAPVMAYACEPGETALEDVWKVLKSFPYMGDFMAYEVVTDLRHTYLLENAPDIQTWANPGPGAARGLCRLLELPLGSLDRNKEKDRFQMIDLMQQLLHLSRSEDNWPSDWGQWELREVEHTLCEFDKYERVRLNEGRPRQRYRPDIKGEENGLNTLNKKSSGINRRRDSYAPIR